MKARSDRFYENKSNYAVGLGIGCILAALALVPHNGTLPDANRWIIAAGIICILIGGTYGSIAKKKGQQSNIANSIKDKK